MLYHDFPNGEATCAILHDGEFGFKRIDMMPCPGVEKRFFAAYRVRACPLTSRCFGDVKLACQRAVPDTLCKNLCGLLSSFFAIRACSFISHFPNTSRV